MATTEQKQAAMSKTARIVKLEARVKALEAILKEAYDHLEWIGYGDSYERECSGTLDVRIEEALKSNTDAPTN